MRQILDETKMNKTNTKKRYNIIKGKICLTNVQN